MGRLRALTLVALALATVGASVAASGPPCEPSCWDSSVASIVVEETGVDRFVDVTVENDGDHPSFSTQLAVTAESSLGVSEIGTVDVAPLAPGSAVEVRVAWLQGTATGTVRIVATLMQGGSDEDPSNDEASIEYAATDAGPSLALGQEWNGTDACVAPCSRWVVGEETYYVFPARVACFTDSAVANRCRGVPAGPGSTLGVFGLVYEESNALPGLQREMRLNGGQLFWPDRMLLL